MVISSHNGFGRRRSEQPGAVEPVACSVSNAVVMNVTKITVAKAKPSAKASSAKARGVLELFLSHAIFGSTVLGLWVLTQPVLAADAYGDLTNTRGNIETRNSGNFELDPALVDSLQFSRVDDEDLQTLDDFDLRTEVSFKVRPSLPNFSRDGARGLNFLNMFGAPKLEAKLEVSQSSRRNVFFGEAVPDLHEGWAYSAGVRIEHNEEASLDSTSFVSSSLLGVSYGRIGKVWYGGVDVNLEQFSDENNSGERDDVVSLDFTTGRRLGFTGLEASSPLWLLSLQGNFDINDDGSVEQLEEDRGDWFLNPSLFWQRPSFTFSAQLQLPVNEEVLDNETPDYRLRAIFEKRF